MDQLKRLLNSLSTRQKITIVLAAILVITGLVGISHWNTERDFKPLFTSLAPEDAGAVVTRLHETGVEYRLAANGSTVLVPSAQVAEVRLQLASAGLPKSGRIGYELFDKPNFGETDFAEQVNYHRALEGELERSVMALAEVEQARVHITFPKDSVFLESRQPAKASVLVRLRPGAHLSAQNILAITNLTASAVEGLTPEAVSVLDSYGNLLSRPRKLAAADGSEAGDELLEYQQRIERETLAKIDATLEPMLGADRFHASVAVDCDLTSGEQSEETFDPNRSVMVSSQRTEDASGAPASAGVPGTSSNLPRPTTPRPAGGGISQTRHTENIAYQSSRIVRRTRLPQGAIKRMSVSVLVDHTVRLVTTGSGANARTQRMVEAPTPEKLKVVRDLVSGVAGIVPNRDQLVVESFPFVNTLSPEILPPPASEPNPYPWAPAWLQRLMREKNFPVLIGAGLGAGIALLGIVFFLTQRVFRKPRISAEGLQALPGGGPAAALEDSEKSLEKQIENKLAEQAAEKARQTAEVLGALKLPAVTTKKAEVLNKQISAEAKKDPQALAQVVRSWLHGED